LIDWSIYKGNKPVFMEDNSEVILPGYVNNSDHPFSAIYPINYKDASGNIIEGFRSENDHANFLTNKKIKGTEWRYYDKDISYTVNSSGYRTREWKDIDWKNSVVVLGDSCTFGEGLPEDETMCSYLEEVSGRPVINLGVPGGSNHVILQNLSILFTKYEIPFAVVINWAPTNRFRYFLQDDYHDTGSWTADFPSLKRLKNGVDIVKLWLLQYLDPVNEAVQTHYLSLQADAICKDRTRYCKVSFWDNTAALTNSISLKKQDKARDMIHPGYESNKHAAATIYNEIYNEQL